MLSAVDYREGSESPKFAHLFRRIFFSAMGALIVSGLILGGCDKTSTPASSPVVSPHVKRHLLVATFADNGGTLTVLMDDRIRVVLAGTSWTQQSADPGIVVATSKPAVLPASSGCVTGQGCGSVTVFYEAVKTGNTQILGTRASCVDAAQTCTTGEGAFRLNVVVVK